MMKAMLILLLLSWTFSAFHAGAIIRMPCA